MNSFYIYVQKHRMNQMRVKTNNIKQTVPLFQTPLSKTSGSPLKWEFNVLTKAWCKLVFSTLKPRGQLSQEMPFHLLSVEIMLQYMPLLLLATVMGVCKARLHFLQMRSCETINLITIIFIFWQCKRHLDTKSLRQHIGVVNLEIKWLRL